MSLPQVIDIGAILAPISAEQPAGIDPRESSSASSPYYRVKDARNAARAEERGATDEDAPVPEIWESVVDLGVELLTTHAKDLEVASWLTEALLRTHGFVGLRDGMTVIGRLVTEFWDHLYPTPDEDGLEIRISPVAGLSGSGATGTLDRPIRRVPLTSSPNETYSFWNYEQAVDFEKVQDERRRRARVEAGAVTLEQFRKSINETAVEELRDTLLGVMECETALASMSAAWDAVAASESPSFTPLQELLVNVAGCIRHNAGDRLAALAQQTGAVAAALVAEASDAAGSAEASEAALGGESGAAAAVRRPGEYGNREEALAHLAQIANYFRRNEPQSPLAYTLDDAARRARLTLHDLLIELVEDPAHVRRILTVAGISTKESDP